MAGLAGQSIQAPAAGRDGLRSGKKVRSGRRKFMLWALAVIGALGLVFVAGLSVFLSRPKFGALPEGERLGRVQASPNYRDGKFQNLIPTRLGGGWTDGEGIRENIRAILGPAKRLIPSVNLPAVKVPDLGRLPDDSLIWFGHSGFLVKLAGKVFLFDPSLGPNASPVPWTTKAFPGTDIYGPGDLPRVDYLLVSHDHWDHVDYPTALALREDAPTVIAPLGVGAHFERWGFGAGKILEGDWWDVFGPEPSLRVTLVPARHFSGRGLTWNQSLWAGFLLEYAGRRIFYGGDGGYLPQYAGFGGKLGPVDLAIIECGQYDPRWKDIHMTPEESVRAALDMGARAAMPVHSGKFTIANHPWDDPFIRFKAAADKASLRAVTPMIGEIVRLGDPGQAFRDWWVGVD
ncbi:MAG: MBL fold metallo-hydrolase [Deltaproteobacteria bacterium]|jgi:L-ascorbate metabolism protein UlaG (beta-lactamase superfamily)|nr:MBL fold metallo-hydrolase [Deltaproteobacteria bacterium]